jgi:uncharacterized membrane protein YcaP (DUF421 family)
MFAMSVPWWEFVVRGVAVYAFLTLLIRLTGKRTIAQLSPFDFVLLLILSNAVQNSMNAGDNSLIGGLISATTLVATDYLFATLTGQTKWLDAFFQGTPQVLIHNGRIDWKVMKSSHISRSDLNAALRRNGVINLDQVRVAMLERSGTISVVQKRARN